MYSTVVLYEKTTIKWNINAIEGENLQKILLLFFFQTGEDNQGQKYDKKYCQRTPFQSSIGKRSTEKHRPAIGDRKHSKNTRRQTTVQ